MTTKTIFGTSSKDILHADTYAGYGTRAGTFPGFNKYKIYGLDGDDSLTAYFNYLGEAISPSERNFELYGGNGNDVFYLSFTNSYFPTAEIYGENGYDYLTLLDDKNNIVGYVRSAAYSPTLKKVIGIAMINKPYWESKHQFKIDINEKIFLGTICDLPFI